MSKPIVDYVAGFLFHRGNVLLQRKARPEWAKGKLNGIGGKVEPADYEACKPLDNRCDSGQHATAREFEEETGVASAPADWHHFHTLTGETYRVRFYRSTRPDDVEFPSAEARAHSEKTGEPVLWVPVLALPDDVIWNLRWLITLALDVRTKTPSESINLPQRDVDAQNASR